MDGFAMTTTRPAFLSALFVLIAVVLLAPFSARAESFLTVADVPVDVTAKSAAAARDQAIANAQIKAFDRLVRRLVPNAADQARIKPSQTDIEGMVQDFAVESERVSSVRYIGLYTVRFRAASVNKYLADAGVAALGDQQQVIVVPVYRGPSGQVLWGQGNPWRTAWDRGGFGDGPVTLILPNGDAFDSGTLSADAAAGGDLTALGAIMQRYHATGVVVATAEPGAGSSLTVTAAIFDSTGPKGTQTLTITPPPGQQADKVLLTGVSKLSDALQSAWRQSSGTGLVGYASSAEADSGQAASGARTLYAIAVPVGSITDWVKIRDQLGAIAGVQRLTLDALTRNRAAITLDFVGDQLALQAALADSGYVLAQLSPPDASGPGTFELRPSGASPVDQGAGQTAPRAPDSPPPAPPVR